MQLPATPRHKRAADILRLERHANSLQLPQRANK
jgi:hypothetical protein